MDQRFFTLYFAVHRPVIAGWVYPPHCNVSGHREHEHLYLNHPPSYLGCISIRYLNDEFSPFIQSSVLSVHLGIAQLIPVFVRIQSLEHQNFPSERLDCPTRGGLPLVTVLRGEDGYFDFLLHVFILAGIFHDTVYLLLADIICALGRIQDSYSIPTFSNSDLTIEELHSLVIRMYTYCATAGIWTSNHNRISTAYKC